MTTTISGTPVEVHYVAVFNAKQKIIGTALRIDPPATVTLQMVGERMGVQFTLPPGRDGIEIVLSRPEIVGIALLDAQKRFLHSFSIPGDPTQRKEGEVFTLRSRYLILAPKKPAS